MPLFWGFLEVGISVKLMLGSMALEGLFFPHAYAKDACSQVSIRRSDGQ